MRVLFQNGSIAVIVWVDEAQSQQASLKLCVQWNWWFPAMRQTYDDYTCEKSRRKAFPGFPQVTNKEFLFWGLFFCAKQAGSLRLFIISLYLHLQSKLKYFQTQTVSILYPIMPVVEDFMWDSKSINRFDSTQNSSLIAKKNNQFFTSEIQILSPAHYGWPKRLQDYKSPVSVTGTCDVHFWGKLTKGLLKYSLILQRALIIQRLLFSDFETLMRKTFSVTGTKTYFPRK